MGALDPRWSDILSGCDRDTSLFDNQLPLPQSSALFQDLSWKTMLRSLLRLVYL